MNYWFLILKIVIIYVVMIILLRILGKREVGQLSIFDLVVLLILADIASLGVDNNEFFIPSFVCLAMLVILQKIVSIFLLKNAKFRSCFDGNPIIIVKDGKILIKNMQKEHYTINDLISQMRLEQIMEINDIKLALLETNGSLSIFKKDDYDKIRLPIIMSGVFNRENLEILSINESDVIEVFHKKDIVISKVLYASYGNREIRYFYRNNNKLKELSQKTIKL